MTPPSPVGAPRLIEFRHSNVRGHYRTNLTDALPYINSTNVSAIVNVSFIFRVEHTASGREDYIWLVSHCTVMYYVMYCFYSMPLS